MRRLVLLTLLFLLASAPAVAWRLGGSVPSVPVNTVAVSIGGDPDVGSTLVCNIGTWAGFQPITFSFQWYRAIRDGNDAVVTNAEGVPLLDLPIAGATTNSYLLTVDYIGERLFCSVIATNIGGSTTVYAPATESIQASLALLSEVV